MVADIIKIMHGPFFAHQFSLVCVYLMCGSRQFFFSSQCGPPRDTKRLDTPVIDYHKFSKMERKAEMGYHKSITENIQIRHQFMALIKTST